MTIFQTIEKANYLASNEDVQAMATAYLAAREGVQSTYGTYFRVLVARTQVAICGKPTLRAKGDAAERLDEADKAVHLDKFEAANAELYAAVLRVVFTSDIEDRKNLSEEEARRRSLERNRRTNFARTAASTLRRFIKAGGDVRKLAVPTCTKSGVGAMVPSDGRGAAAPSEDRTRQRVERAADNIVSLVQALAQEDKSMAATMLQSALSRIAPALIKLGLRSTTKPEVAVEEHRLLKTANGTFWPAAIQ